MSRQCPSCGGFCRRSGCERANVEVKMTDEQPALYQRRMKPLFDYKFPWSAWEECSKEVFHQYERQQVWGDYVYEARKLYEHPAPAVVRQLVDGLTGLIDFIEIDNLRIDQDALRIAKAALAAAERDNVCGHVYMKLLRARLNDAQDEIQTLFRTLENALKEVGL